MVGDSCAGKWIWNLEVRRKIFNLLSRSGYSLDLCLINFSHCRRLSFHPDSRRSEVGVKGSKFRFAQWAKQTIPRGSGFSLDEL